MNGWNGFALPGVSGMMGNVGPLGMGGYGGAMAAPMPVSGMEVMAPQQSYGALNPVANLLPNLQGAGNPGGWMGIAGLGRNLDTAKLGIGALGSIANIWNASQQNKLAKASFNHQKGILDTNLANQIKSYNLSIDDKFRSRAVVEGRSSSERDADIAKWSARDERKG